MFEALVLDEYAVSIIANAAIEDTWFGEFSLPANSSGLRREVVGSYVYLLSSRADERSRILVVKLGPDAISDTTKHPRQMFGRVLHVALHRFEDAVSLPVQWKQYRRDALLSIYALTAAKGEGQRLYFDLNPDQSENVFCYAYLDPSSDFQDIQPDLSLFKSAGNKYIDALLQQTVAPPIQADGAGAFGIVLTSPLGTMLTGNASLDEWYRRRLTLQQRQFVDKDHSGPVRLKGAAGTGKTISMAVKCLLDVYKFEDATKDARVAFVTHSSALAHDVLPSMFYGLDPSNRWGHLDHTKLWLGSIYELAQDFLQYEQKNLRPLSTDGREGREFQNLLIGDAIHACKTSSLFVHHTLARCSPVFRELFHDMEGQERFITELANEFSSVVDAEFVRLGTPSADQI